MRQIRFFYLLMIKKPKLVESLSVELIKKYIIVIKYHKINYSCIYNSHK